MNRTTVQSFGVTTAVAPQIVSANDTSDPIDLAGFEAATVVVTTGAVAGAGNFSLKLQESDSTVAGDFTDVAAGDLVNAAPASLQADSVVRVGYRGFKRYLRTVLTRNSGTSIAASVIVIHDHARVKPVA